MKTRVYIDGYNLYYGYLKRTPYKWLDLTTLFIKHILPSSSNQPHSYDDLSIKFFTVDIVGKAAMSEDSLKDQQAYHRALAFHAGENNLEIIKGYYAINQTRAFKVDECNPKKPPNQCEYVDIWKLEEKQTDVNIAVESLYDVMTDKSIEQVVFVTTDSMRIPNEKLDKLADWTRKNILEDELKASQLPRSVEGGRKAAIKPIGWFGQPAIIENIFETLLKVEKNRTKCWRWLEKQPPAFEDLPPISTRPINLLDDEDSAKTVLLYAQKYVEFKQDEQKL